MKRILIAAFLLAIPLLAIPLLAATLLAACSQLSKETADSGAAVAELWQEINADGMVTDAESQEYLAALQEWYGHVSEDVEGIDWEELAYTVGGAASVAFLGVNVFRNRVQGKGGLIVPQHKGTLPPAT